MDGAILATGWVTDSLVAQVANEYESRIARAAVSRNSKMPLNGKYGVLLKVRGLQKAVMRKVQQPGGCRTLSSPSV